MNTCIELFLHNLDNNIHVIIYIRYCETSAISQYPVEWFLMSLKNGIFFGFFATSTSKLCCHDRSRELCYMMTPPPSVLQHRLCRTYKHEVGIRFIVLNFWDENSLVPCELSKRYKKGMVPNCSLTWLIDKTKCVYSSLTTKYIIAIRIFIFSPLAQFGHFT